MGALLQAMFVSFGMAAESNGDCYLRFDDTNPEAEKLEYIEHIQDIVSWMGWKPYKVRRCSRICQELLGIPQSWLPLCMPQQKLLHAACQRHMPQRNVGGLMKTAE